MSSKPRAIKKSTTTTRAPTKPSKQNTNETSTHEQNGKKAENLIDLTDSAEGRVWDNVFRPFAAAIMATDVIFLTTFLQTHNGKPVPSNSWDFAGLLSLCLGLLFLGFWYFTQYSLRWAKDWRMHKNWYERFTWILNLGLLTGIAGITVSIGLVSPIIGWVFAGIVFTFTGLFPWIIKRATVVISLDEQSGT